MKLQCQVDLSNRVHVGLNVRTTRRYLKATLALGKEPNSENEYFILYFSTNNKTGTKYPLKNNINKVYTRCVNEGKATISFVNPQHDIYIQSEVIQLKCFLRLLQSCLAGNPDVVHLSSLTSVTRVQTTPTKLVIQDRSQFPKNGLPRTLQSLHINGLKMCNFRREILVLKHLTVLDLSKNLIEKLPPELGNMPNLKELYLSSNKLGKISNIDWRWLLGPGILKTLRLLDLSNNHLKTLPNAIWKMQQLYTLKVDDNELENLPPAVSRIQTLRYLTISRNKLKTLPGNLIECPLEYFDLSANHFHCGPTEGNWFDMSAYTMNPKRLMHQASEVILKRKIYYASNIIPHTLVEFLDNVNLCTCGKLAIDDRLYRYKFYNMSRFRIVMCNVNIVGFDCYYCSIKCMLSRVVL